MMLRTKKKTICNKKFNILFISNDFNYFIDNNASFNRLYNNLIYFYKHKDFNVVILQPDRERKKENKSLKENITCYYFKEIRILGNHFVHFIDFNPFFISKVMKILKKHRIDLIHVDFIYGINILKLLTTIPISYNSHNVEAIYYRQVGKYFYKIPIFLRALYVKYIDFLEKRAIEIVKNINAISYKDKKKFIKLYNVPEEKIIVTNMGYKKEIFNNPIEQNQAIEKLKLDISKFIVIFHCNYFLNAANKEAIQVIKEKIAPRIKNDEILFLIAGKMPPFKDKRNLKFIGFVDDLKQFLYSADIAIVPIFRGSGVRVKIIDYLSAKIPVITTKQGIEGLILKNNYHGYIVGNDNPIEEIIEKIKKIKNNPNIISEFKRNIEELLNEHYDWDKNLVKLAKRYSLICKVS